MRRRCPKVGCVPNYVHMSTGPSLARSASFRAHYHLGPQAKRHATRRSTVPSLCKNRQDQLLTFLSTCIAVFMVGARRLEVPIAGMSIGVLWQTDSLVQSSRASTSEPKTSAPLNVRIFNSNCGFRTGHGFGRTSSGCRARSLPRRVQERVVLLLGASQSGGLV